VPRRGRGVGAAHRRHLFGNSGVQAYEQEDQYKARRIRDRFTSEMLASYAAELDLRPFDEDFYTNQGLLIESRQKVDLVLAGSSAHARHQHDRSGI